MEKQKIDYLIDYLSALTQIKNTDGSTVLWANQRASAICELIEEELRNI